MIRVAIVDDEAEVCSTLERYLRQYGESCGTEFSVSTFKSGVALLSADSLDFDIVFLDVMMPYMNGMETAQNLRLTNKTCALVFVTNMIQYAVDGYAVDAMDFVVKPVEYEVFAFKMKRILERAKLREERNVVLKTSDGTVYLDVQDIFYVEIVKHDLKYHSAQGDFSVRGSLSEVEKELEGKAFYRCNSCYLVNLNYVTGIEGDCAVVHGERLRISGPKRQGFFSAMMQFLRR